MIVLEEFIKEMEKKLQCNKDKGNRAGWINLTYNQLLMLLYGEVDELEEAISSSSDKDEDDIISECADIANFAMMIANRARIMKEIKEADKAINQGKTKPINEVFDDLQKKEIKKDIKELANKVHDKIAKKDLKPWRGEKTPDK